jgi:hypothetical protein
MHTNLGAPERTLRLFIALGLFVTFLESASLLMLGLSLVLALTGATGSCPFYQLTGLSSRPRRGAHR